MNKILFLVVSGVLTFSSSSYADSLTAVDLEEVITLYPGGAELRLKGSAIKSNARQAVYIGGLYLENDAQSVNEILSSVGEKRFLIKTSAAVKPETIIRAINLGITVNHTEQELTDLEPAIKQFNMIWSAETHEGDEICVDYHPIDGTIISVNGVKKGQIAGDTFYKAFLKTWIGDKPLNKNIKKQLVGK